MEIKKSEKQKLARAPILYMTIPRQWVIALVAILVVPSWFGVAAFWLKKEDRANLDVENASPKRSPHSGKWGDLSLVPIVIAPPMELVFTDWGFMPRPTWYFPGSNADMVAQILLSSGVPPTEAAMLRAEARSVPRIAGVVLEPDPAWVRALTPEVRSRLYHILAQTPLNVDQTQAFRYPGVSPEEWFGRSPISQHTRELVEPLIYRDGNYMLFSDIELVRTEIGSDDEMRLLGKALFQQSTVIVNLSVDRTANLDELVEYWGRGGRRTEIRPLLESIAGGGPERAIDVTHLLPPFAQNHLYSYPQLTAGDLDKPAVVNCLWTALNFFRETPDNRFLDASVALNTLKEDYFVIESDFELGDIVAFLDEEGNIFHAVVYIADNLVFSKNGISAMAPWTIMSLEDVKDYYRWRCEIPRLIAHRRKDL